MQTTFSYNVKCDLASIPVKSPCCKRALLFGLLYAATLCDEGGLEVSFSHDGVSALAEELIKEVFKQESPAEPLTVVGRKLFRHHVSSKKAAAFVAALDGNAQEPLSALVGFKCANCRICFLRGIFLSIGTVTDPQKASHAELLLSKPGRAEKLDDFLALCGIPARRTERSGRVVLYYKKSTDLEEFFAELGGNSLVFELINLKIEKEIRNNENRATNCVATNIARTVNATAKQLASIEALKERDMLEGLPEDLRITAELRLQNGEASLAELAALHTPPLSKSGLNHRLTRLVSMAEKYL